MARLTFSPSLDDTVKAARDKQDEQLIEQVTTAHTNLVGSFGTLLQTLFPTDDDGVLDTDKVDLANVRHIKSQIDSLVTTLKAGATPQPQRPAAAEPSSSDQPARRPQPVRPVAPVAPAPTPAPAPAPAPSAPAASKGQGVTSWVASKLNK